MTKSELIDSLYKEHGNLPDKDIESVIKSILEHMSQALAAGERIEIRGFGSFSLHFRPPRIGRNPKTGEAVALAGKYVPHFKPGKDLRERVNKYPPQPQPPRKTPKAAAKVEPPPPPPPPPAPVPATPRRSTSRSKQQSR